jgi:hypothetical protein
VGLLLLLSLCALGTALTVARVWLVTRMSPLWRGRTRYATWAVQAVVLVLLSGIETAVIGVCANAPALAACWRMRGRRPRQPLPPSSAPTSPVSPAFRKPPMTSVIPGTPVLPVGAAGGAAAGAALQSGEPASPDRAPAASAAPLSSSSSSLSSSPQSSPTSVSSSSTATPLIRQTLPWPKRAVVKSRPEKP